MKKILILILFIALYCCSTRDNSNLIFGAWEHIIDSSNYSEFQINETHLVILRASDSIVTIKKSRIDNNLLIIDNQKYSPKIDTFEIVHIGQDSLLLKRNFLNQKYSFVRIINSISEIDSSNLQGWQEKTLSDFRKRVKLNLGGEYEFKIDTFPVTLNHEEIETKIDTSTLR